MNCESTATTTAFPLFLDFPMFLISQDLSNTLVSCFSLTELHQNQFLVSQTQPSSYSQCQGNIKVSLANTFWWRVLAQIKAQTICPCFLRANSFQSRTNASFFTFELQWQRGTWGAEPSVSTCEDNPDSTVDCIIKNTVTGSTKSSEMKGIHPFNAGIRLPPWPLGHDFGACLLKSIS